MNIIIERFFSKKGFIYSINTTNSDYLACANYTIGFLLRKIEVYNLKEVIYTLKQENILLKVILNLFRLFYRPTDIPEYNLYYKKKYIGKSEKYSNHKLNININNNLLTIKKIESSSKREHIIHIVNKGIVILIIKKNKLRYGKKNIYNVIYDNWIYDESLMILLIAFCDVVFFPEWFRWSAVEYDIGR